MVTEPEKHVPVNIVFHAGWWYKHYGISFDQHYYLDPEHRVEVNRKMERLLYQRFRDLGMGHPDPPPRASVQNFWDCTLQQALFGCEIEFSEGDYPWAKNLDLCDEEVMALRVPATEHTYPATEMFRQADYLEEKYGGPVLGRNQDSTWEGVQNVGLTLRGNNLMLDYYQNPEIARRLFDVVTESIIALNRAYDSHFGRPGLYITGNCTVVMISPKMYEDYLLACDNSLSRALTDSEHGFGVHHCGVIDRYLDSYARIENLQFLEAGWGSDIARVREVFPKIRLNARYGPARIMRVSADQVRMDISKLIHDGAPLENFSISIYGVDYGTPDENIRAMFHTAWEESQGITSACNTHYSGPFTAISRGR